MNKTELVKAIAARQGMSQVGARAALEGLLRAVTEALQRGDKVQLNGFGSFSTRTLKARQGTNPRTGEPLDLPARRTVTLRAATALRDQLQASAASSPTTSPRPHQRPAATGPSPARDPGAARSDHGPAATVVGQADRSAASRRRERRVPVALQVEYDDVESFLSEYTRNISKGGAFIRSDRQLAPGTELVFKLHVPMFTEPMELKGRVAWVRRPDEATIAKPPGMGVEFVYDSDEDKFVNDRIVEDLQKRLRES